MVCDIPLRNTDKPAQTHTFFNGNAIHNAAHEHAYNLSLRQSVSLYLDGLKRLQMPPVSKPPISATGICIQICRYQHDLVLLPLFGSVGSSLSLVEAMAARCAVVSTNVDGLSKMIINQFNDLMGMPDADTLAAKLEYCLQNLAEAKRLAFQAHATAARSLSLARWQQDWLQYLLQLGVLNPTSSYIGVASATVVQEF